MAVSTFVWVPFILQAAAVVLLFFVILAGVDDSAPLNETFFISADISSFNTGINSPSGYGQWTLWGVCGATRDGKNVNCGDHHAAYPFSPYDNFGNGVPPYFVDHRHFFYYTTRFMFAFFIIAVAFAVFSVSTGLLALCSRLGSAVSSIFVMAAFVIDIIATSLMTAAYVRGRDEFTKAGITASLGVKAFGFAWGSVGCLLFATFGFCCVACGPGRRGTRVDYISPPTRTTRFWNRRNRKVQADTAPVI
jgi:hypothetical protein